MGYFLKEHFFLFERPLLYHTENNLFTVFRKIIFLFVKFDIPFELKFQKILKISENLKWFVLQRLFFLKSYCIFSLNKMQEKKNLLTRRIFIYSSLRRKIAEKVKKIFFTPPPLFFEKDSKYKLGDFFSNEKIPMFIKKKGLLFPNKRFMLNSTKNSNCYFKAHGGRGNETFPIEQKKKKVSDVFNHSTSEFSQLKGWFNTSGRRIKNFSIFWNQSSWLNNEFYSKNIYKALNAKNIKEELFLIIFFCQTNKTDMCSVCNFQKGLKNNLIYSKISTFLIWKILCLENIWNRLFSQKKQQLFNYKNTTFSTDSCLDKSFFYEKKGQELKIRRNSEKKLHALGNFCYRKTNTIICPSDKFLPVFCKNKLKKKKIFGGKKYGSYFEKNNKNKNNPQYFLWKSKCIDSFFPKIPVEFIFISFQMIEKLKEDQSLNETLNFLLFQSFQMLPFKVNSKDQLYNKISLQYQQFLKAVKNKNDNLSISYTEFPNTISKLSLSKEKIFLNFQMWVKEALRDFNNFEILNITINTCHIYPFLYIDKLKIRLDFENREILLEKLLVYFQSLFEFHMKNPFSKPLSPKKWKSKGIGIIHGFKLQNDLKSSNLKLSFSIGNSSEREENSQFEIFTNIRQFSTVISFVCAKFKIKLLFILEASGFQQKLISHLKFDLSRKLNNLSTSINTSKEVFSAFNFLFNIQIIPLDSYSFNLQLASTLFGRRNSTDSKKNLLYSTLKLLEEDVGTYSWFVSGKKAEYFPKILLGKSYIHPDSFRAVLVFVLRKLFSEFQLKLKEYFCGEKRSNHLFIFLCGLGPRKGLNLVKKLTKHTVSPKEFSDNLQINYSLNNYKPGNFFFKGVPSFTETTFRKKLKIFEFSKKFLFHLDLFERNSQFLFYKNLETESLYKSYEERTGLYKIRNTELFHPSSDCKSNSRLLLDGNPNKDYTDPKNINEISNKEMENGYKSLNFLCSGFFLKSWKNRLLDFHSVGEITFLTGSQGDFKSFLNGKTNLGIPVFLEKKNIFAFVPKFPLLIQRNIINFPAKILSIYPKISIARVDLIPRRFIPLSSWEKLEIQNISDREKHTFQTVRDVHSYIRSLGYYRDLENERISEWIGSRKSGELFLWKYKGFFLKISLVIDPKKKTFFSFPVEIQYDKFSKLWVFIHQQKIFFGIEELVEQCFKILKNRVSGMVHHKDYFPGTSRELKKIITKAEEKVCFRFGVENDSTGECFILIKIFKNKILSGFFRLRKDGYYFNRKIFSSFDNLKKAILKMILKKNKKIIV